ncbi:hypothetical protein [Thalassomonas haliotis]|uniref:Uncharacterized protein n=1 Tax=Thalassomonas haliotis TaxID=485448 RepID=A0ABY7VFJ6_9GAMM|nr:hypothetical protein [Thalassomonas haliotis]WDE12171.1 hypothetical protein H3N35_01400 [Thalassomonas haliotis]
MIKTIKTTLKTFTLTFALLVTNGQSAVAGEYASQESVSLSGSPICADSPTRCEIKVTLGQSVVAGAYASQESIHHFSASICADSPTRCEIRM